MRVVREVLLAVVPTSQHACCKDTSEGPALYFPVVPIFCNTQGSILTEMFDLLLVFLHKVFMLLLLLFFGLVRRIRFDINNALRRTQAENLHY